MPLIVGPDPNNPGKFIWIDSATGQPAAQPGGPGTPYVAGTGTSSAPVDGSAAQKSLDAIAAQQGQGWTVTGWPTPKTDAQGIPVAGQYTIVLSGPNGAQRIGTVVAPSGVNVGSDPLGISWTLSGIEEPIKAATTSTDETNAQILKAQQDALAAQTLAAQRDQQLKDLQKDNAQRDANKTSTGYAVTDVERATIENNARQAGLTQQQIDNQLKVASDNNQISRAANETAALNAATNAFSAQRNAEAQLAQTLHIQRGDDESAAKFEREKADRDIANRIAQDKLKLEQLQQSQANLIAQGQLAATQGANALRGQELEQRTAEAKQTAETAAIGQNLQAAANIYGTERQAQQQAAQTGQSLLQNRAGTFQNLVNEPFAAAGALSRGSAGKYGMLSGGGVNIPSGAIGQLLGGAQGLSTAMYGGQSSVDAAVQAVQAIAPGAPMTPMMQAGAALLRQILDSAKQTAGVGKVNAPATAGPPAQPAAAAATPAATTAPMTVPLPANQYQGNFAGQDIQELMRQQMQQHLTPQMSAPAAMTAPTTQPTININFSGGGGGMRVM